MAIEKRKKSKEPVIYDNRVKMYADGKYHWVQSVNLFKNPAVLIDLYSVLGLTMIIFLVIILSIMLFAEGFSAEAFTVSLSITGVTAGILFVLGILGYLLYAALVGGKYVVQFTMDEDGIEHKQVAQSKNAAEKIGCLAALVGIFAKKPGVAGAGMLASSRTSMLTNFTDVKRVKPCRRMNMIKVNETLQKNRVYVCNEDFDFVLDFIRSHCPQTGRNTSVVKN